MAAPENQGKETKILARPASIFRQLTDPKKLFIPLLLLGFLISVFVSFSILPKTEKEEAPAQIENPREKVSFDIVETDLLDNSGRTVIYTKRGLFDGLGGERTFQDSPVVVGKVSGWDDGLVLVLEDGTRYRIAKTGEETPTTLMVEDLLVSAENLSEALVPIAGVGSTLREENIRLLIQSGDVVAVVLTQDFKDGVSPLAVVLRRFGGVEQLEKELGFRLSSPR